MQLKEILSIEENRTEDSRGVIHLFQEGTFYRAYEWSAWLCHRYVHQFKVTHKLFRNIESSVLFVGFPVTSLPKYVQEGTSVFDVDEKFKDLVLADDVIPEGMTVDVMKTDYEAWKASVPVTESITDESLESNCSMIENIPPKGMSFADYIATFAMSYQNFACF